MARQQNTGGARWQPGSTRPVGMGLPLDDEHDGRCRWALASPEMLAYHDHEWGVPVRDERTLFERLTLEGAQAGLSWSLILAKREGYRKAFAGFAPDLVARFARLRRRTAPRRRGHRPQPPEDRVHAWPMPR